MTEEAFKRKLTAILSADVEGYSRLMGEDEDATIRTLTSYRELMSTLIQKHRGRVVDSPGDNLLAEFLSVVDAVRCAVEIQEELRVRNAELPGNRRMDFRIGINLGDVVQEEERIYGDGINIAARVEGLAEGGGICISGAVYDSIKNKLSLSYESLGEHTVKNIKEPVRVYRMRVGPEAVVKTVPRRWHKATLAAVAVLVVVAGAWAIWNFYFRPPPIEPASVEKMAYPLPDNPSIAVLPFVNMSGDPEQDYIADGFSENIITALSYIPQMFVIARSSSFTYKGKPVKVQQVSEELGVRYILEGSVLKSGDKVRITAQLIDALTGGHIWSERFDRDFNDLLNLLDEVTLAIAVALQVELTEGEKARIITTDNLDAWRYLEKARYIWNLAGNPAKGREFLERALEIDPEYADAVTGLAWTHMYDARLGLTDSRRKSFKRAVELAKKSVALDDNQPSVHGLLLFIYLFQKQHDKAIEEGRKAIALGPSNADVHIWLGEALYSSGIFEEAVQMCEKAMRLHPLTPLIYFGHMMNAYYWAGRYDESLEMAEQLIDRGKAKNPKIVWWGYWGSARAHIRLGQETEAREDVAKLLKLRPDYNLDLDRRNTVYKPEIIEREYVDMRKAGVPEHAPLPLPDKPSIAVLSFVNISGDPKQEYLSDGITEQLIASISKIPRLFVIARTSSFKYKGKAVDVKQVGRELGVKYVLEGSVQKSGNRLRITAQLIDATTGRHIWSESYDRTLKEIFELQDEITLEIVRAMRVKLTEGEQDLWRKGSTNNLKAFLKALEAVSYVRRMNKESNIMAHKLSEEAISMDPGYAMAYTILASAHMMDVWLGYSKSKTNSLKAAAQLLQKSIDLDATQDYPHALLGYLYSMKRQYDKAIEEGERAIALNPNSADAYVWLAVSLRHSGRLDNAFISIKKALRLSPFPPSLYLLYLGHIYRDSGMYEEAISTYEKVVSRQPDNLFAHIGLTACYSLIGREKEAQAAASEVLRINPKFSVEYYAKMIPGKDQSIKDRFIDSLRKAGLK